MHTLHEKRGRKTVTHYFHHVTEKDGTKKHVYLGTDPRKGKEKLTMLRAQRITSDNKTVKELDSVQAKLDEIGNFNRSYDDILADIKIRHAKGAHAEKLLANEVRSNFPLGRYFAIAVSIVSLTAILFFLSDSPVITGAAVNSGRIVADMALSNAGSTTFIILTVVLVLGMMFYSVEYAHKHRHDRYKPPE
jgi:hypothetical protein